MQINTERSEAMDSHSLAIRPSMIHLRVNSLEIPQPGMDNQGYLILVGTRSALESGRPANLFRWHKDFARTETTVVPAKPIPVVWQMDITRYLQRTNGLRSAASLGFISYMLYNGDAFAMGYYPKQEIGPRVAPGLAYFIESVVVNDLRRSGLVQRIGDGTKSSGERVRQLRRVGIDPKGRIAINEWLAKLGKGIRESAAAERARQEQTGLLRLLRKLDISDGPDKKQ
ncbi:MAG: hypothetical protein KGH94_04055 [Candidatus Micrarchaeota archaeon]|nr:hypothetical protein [Candidatus Micrarchaeota archaeon]